MHVELQVFANGAATTVSTARTVATINRISAGEVEHEPSGCLAILPNESCTVSVDVLNTGNAYNTFVLREVGTTGGFEVNVPAGGQLVQANQGARFDDITITASADALAFTVGTTTIEVLDDTGQVVDSTTVEMKVAPQIKWSFRNVEEQVNAKGGFLLQWKCVTTGTPLTGSLCSCSQVTRWTWDSSHLTLPFTKKGLIPRSFEVNDIPLNSNFTIRAWVQLPQDQIPTARSTSTPRFGLDLRRNFLCSHQ